MSSEPLVSAPLTPRLLSLREVEEIAATWEYDPQPFYVGQVQRSLDFDIPLLMKQGICAVWGYYDPGVGQQDQPVGFGAIHLSTLYSDLTDRKPHFYIPLLSVRPKVESKGYGSSIVNHLVQEAERARSIRSNHTSDLLFLDVYGENDRAIRCYLANGFEIINEEAPLHDEVESGAPYFVMAKLLRS